MMFADLVCEAVLIEGVSLVGLGYRIAAPRPPRCYHVKLVVLLTQYLTVLCANTGNLVTHRV